LTSSELLNNLRNRGISATQMSDAVATALLDDVLRTYNHYRPQMDYATLTTVAYQTKYDADSSLLRVVDVYWEPSGTSDVVSTILSELAVLKEDFDYPSISKIYYTKRHRLRDVTHGRWRWDGTQIWLIPTPTTSDDIVPYVFTKAFTSISAVPTADEELLVMLFEALALRYIANTQAGEGGWRAGSYSVDGATIREERRDANLAYQRVCALLGGGGVVKRD